jgi:hypothetical protein
VFTFRLWGFMPRSVVDGACAVRTAIPGSRARRCPYVRHYRAEPTRTCIPETQIVRITGYSETGRKPASGYVSGLHSQCGGITRMRA